MISLFGFVVVVLIAWFILRPKDSFPDIRKWRKAMDNFKTPLNKKRGD